MALETPVVMQAVGGDTPFNVDARALRTLPDAIYSSEGVVGVSDLTVTQRGAGANMSVDVSAGMVIVQGDAITNQGKYVMRSTSVQNVTITAAPGTGSRTDIIVAQLYDRQADGGSQYAWDIIAVAGTTTAPASSVILARITVPAGTGSITTAANITITGRQFATMHRVSRPTQTTQVSTPTFSTTGSFVDFTSGQWPPLTATFPASGMMWVTVSADLNNTNTTVSTIWATFRVTSGSGTWNGDQSLSAAGGRVYASRRTLVSGTPNTSITYTPQWNVSSDGGSSVTNLTNGTLTAEPVT